MQATDITEQNRAAEYDGPVLEINNLSISFFTRDHEIPAVMDFSCTIRPGEAMGLREIDCGAWGDAIFGPQWADH
jgi:hypothetical protein